MLEASGKCLEVSATDILGTAATYNTIGNQYSIENELGTEARMVFCQGCEVIPEAFLSDLEE